MKNQQNGTSTIADALGEVLSPSEKEKPSKHFLLGLLAATFAVSVVDVFAPLLYPEIAQTFNIQVGTAVQLSAFSAVAGIITGFTLSIFSVKVRYKTLLLAGVFCIVICALGVFFAPTFLIAQIFYSLNGVGSVIVGVMSSTIIGELYPLDKKAIRISWVFVTAQLAILVGSPITGYIAGYGETVDWHSALLWFTVPVTAASLMLVYFLVPSKPMVSLNLKKEPFINGLKGVLGNKSAVICLIYSFSIGMLVASNIFASSFMKSTFAFSPFMRGLVPAIGTLLIIAGTLVGGLLINKAGRKRLTIMSSVPTIVLSTAAYVLMIYTPNVGLFLALRWISGFLAGFLSIAGANLALEQVTKYRGTMMSLNSALSGSGGAFGALFGGALINYFSDPMVGYPLLMVIFGVIGIVGSGLIYFAKEPTENKSAA
ncbi:MAG: MFS transporter [Candidatus Bathyarchaeia archaeon]|jgi:predicted MFS family arabinose efflux permease